MAAPATELEKEARDRLAQARLQKAEAELDIREAYFFGAPRRKRGVTSTSSISQARPKDEALAQNSIARELTADFATAIINTFMPQAEPWCERTRGMVLPKKIWEQIKGKVEEADAAVFDGIKGSNCYAALSMGAVPDLAIGVMGLWIDVPLAGGEIVCQSVPIREIEINLGPYGVTDDRFIVRQTRNRHIRSLVGNIKLPPEIEQAIEKKPKEATTVTWGYWRLWQERGDVCWQHVLMIKDRVIYDEVLRGEGCCPFLVIRFGPNADFAWADGPLIQALEDLRYLDELDGMKVEHIDFTTRPAVGYPDDSFAAIENGIESGAAYPIRPGSGRDIVNIGQPGQIDAALYESAQRESRLRKLFFVDYPQQEGKTPPTLGQWIDEMAMAQRRIGTPGMSFWQEGPAAIFARYLYLMEKHGWVEKIVDDQGRTTPLRARNPAQRAAEQQEVALAYRGIQMMAAAFPEEWKAFVDGKATIAAFLDKMRVKLVVFRSEEQVAAALKIITPLLQQGAAASGVPEQAVAQ